MAQNFDILILCSGKSGSSTLYTSFINNGYNTLKVHSKLDYVEQFKKDKLYESIDLSSQNKKICIIDVYRNPIERKISSFFQNINDFVPDWKVRPIEYLIRKFNNKYIYTLEEYHSINEAFRYYNIPYFKTFDFQKKFNIIEKDNKIFIKILYKDINEWKYILRYIFNKRFIIKNSNLSDTKDYYPTYQEFLEKYKLPKKYLNRLINKDIEFKVYNTPEEQKEYIDYWKENSY